MTGYAYFIGGAICLIVATFILIIGTVGSGGSIHGGPVTVNIQQLREKIGAFPRIALVVFSVFGYVVGTGLILAGAGSDTSPQPQPSITPLPSALQTAAPTTPGVRINLTNTLDHDLESAETAVVSIERAPEQTLAIDETSPQAEAPVSLPNQGRYHYTVSVEADLRDGDILRCSQQGEISVNGGETFRVSWRISPDGTECSTGLQPG